MNNFLKYLFDNNSNDNENLVNILSCEKYRIKQIKEFVLKGIDFENINNIPQSLKEKLAQNFTSAFSIKIIKTNEDIQTGAKKFLIELEDKNLIEAVILTNNGIQTSCLSSQVGCACECAFCATGTLGLKRNLTPYEIIEEFILLNRENQKTCQKSISRIVFMGMGEPLLNLGAVSSAIDFIEKNFSISKRKITISTSGIIGGIKELTKLNLGVRLALSLVTANENLREKLMPVAKNNPLNKIKEALLEYQKNNGRPINLECCLMSKINTDFENAKKIALFTKGLLCDVNLIPWNPIDTLNFKTPNKQEVNQFCKYLTDLNVKWTIREERGRKTTAACGQLVAKKDSF